MVHSLSSAVHPSLYPLLLFLSKMRAPLTAEVLPVSEPFGSGRSRDLNPLLFLPMLEKCLEANVYQVRSMAARGCVNYNITTFEIKRFHFKAFASLVSIDMATSMASSVLQTMASDIASVVQSQKRLIFRFNSIHGTLLAVRELLSNINRSLYQIGSSQNLINSVMRGFNDLFPALYRIISLLGTARCAAVHLELLHILTQLRDIVFRGLSTDSKDIVDTLLVFECQQSLQWESDIARSVVIGQLGAQEQPAPFEAVLWQRALSEVVRSTCKENLNKDPLLPPPFGTDPLEVITHYLNSRISEVRLGVLEGIYSLIVSDASNSMWLDDRLWLSLIHI